MSSRINRCRICGEELVGRAMGGHMRKHYNAGAHKPPEAQPETQSELDVKAVAAELLSKVVFVINETSGHLNEIATLRSQILDLECRLKKAYEERDRTIRIHNEAVKQQNDGRLPTVESVTAALRRDHVRGKSL